MHRLWSLGVAWASQETQPRFGGTLDGVKRLQQTLVPRARQAPDGRKEGGSQPTESRRINRRLFLAPALAMDAVHKMKNMQNNRQPPLDIGSHINAALQGRLEAGARDARTLEAVTCTRWLGVLAATPPHRQKAQSQPTRVVLSSWADRGAS
jgi:hypothetical protein